MPSIEPRINAQGQITSYRIVVSHGYRKDRTQVKHTFLWSPNDPDMSERTMEREATAAAYKYEEQVKNGFNTDSKITFEDYAAYVMGIKEQAGVRPTTLERYFEMLPTINRAIGYLELQKIRPDILNTFYGELLCAPRKDKVKARATRNLMNLLDECGISNQKLARSSALSPSTITNAVRGDLITLKSAESIANALGRNVRDLFQMKGSKTLLAPKTVLEYHRLISTILHQAEKEMIIMYNPASRASPPKATAPSPDYYQPEQMEEILDALDNAPLLWKAITYVLMDTGCRRGEALAFTWESVNLDTGIVVIDHSLQYTKRTGIYLGPTKTEKVRAQRLAPQTIALLKQWQKEQLRKRLLKGPDWYESGMVFTQDDGTWLHPDSITQWLRKFSEEKGLPHIHPHAFRHTVASTMIANGVDLVTTANELGHANATTTAKIYAHQIAVAQARAAEVRCNVFAEREAKKAKGSKLRSKYRGA